MRILMVCLGNICRSPLAEGILKNTIQKYNLNWHVDSAGTSGWHAGEYPDQRSIKTALHHKIDITDQRSRKIAVEDFENFDLILAMDKQNLSDLKTYFSANEEIHEKIRQITEFSTIHSGKDIPDPYYDDNGFEKVFNMLEESIEGLINFYRNTG